MEPVSTALAGIALVKSSVDFIKGNLDTVKDIGEYQVLDTIGSDRQGCDSGGGQFDTDKVCQPVAREYQSDEHQLQPLSVAQR